MSTYFKMYSNKCSTLIKKSTVRVINIHLHDHILIICADAECYLFISYNKDLGFTFVSMETI